MSLSPSEIVLSVAVCVFAISIATLAVVVVLPELVRELRIWSRDHLRPRSKPAELSAHRREQLEAALTLSVRRRKAGGQ